MDTKPAPQDSTAILEQLAAEFTARFPDDGARIARGLELVGAGHVEPTLVARMWLVRSSCADDRAYHTTSWQCSCPDHTARERRCKHSWAVTLATALEDELRHRALVAGAPIGYTLTSKGAAVVEALPVAYELTGKAYAALQPRQDVTPWQAPSELEWAAIAAQVVAEAV